MEKTVYTGKNEGKIMDTEVSINFNKPPFTCVDIMYTNLLFPLITLPTRITSFTATIIDNIFTNDLENYSFSGLILSDISDHLPIFSMSYEIFRERDEASYIEYRDKSAKNIFNFRNCLSHFNWYDLEDISDPQKGYLSFLNKFNELFNNCFPIKRIKKRKCTTKKPWLSKGLLKSIGKKNRLYKRYLNCPSNTTLSNCKKYKNKLNHSIRIAKRLYYEQQLMQNRLNCKKTWSILNEIINKRKQGKKVPSSFLVNGVGYSDPNFIANQFCKYFSRLGPNLASKIQNVSVSPSSFLSGEFVNSLFLELVTEQEVLEIVKRFKNGVASGYDNLPVFAIKESIDLIVNILTHLVNLSMTSGIFPDPLKLARVVPIFKSGDARTITNYRPVSVLPIFSKVFERLVYNRLLDYVETCGILTENQYGFRKNISNTTFRSICR